MLISDDNHAAGYVSIFVNYKFIQSVNFMFDYLS